MKLLSDATTPFGRKVLVAALERSIVLEEVYVPLDGTGPLDTYNPLRQIPTLVLSNGRAVYDSNVILEYLDTCHHGEPLISPSIRIEVLTRLALCDGLIEATLLRRLETIRNAQERSASFIDKMEQRIKRALAALESQMASFARIVPLAADQIGLACALGYVDFRYSESWRAAHSALKSWYAEVGGRSSLLLTAPTRKRPVSPEDFRPS